MRKFTKDGRQVGKYGSIQRIVDNIKFPSIKEAEYYILLKSKLLGGDIKGFKRQVKYELRVNEVLVCSYICDFVVSNWDGTWEVIDVKSDFTRKIPLYKIKKALMQAVHSIKIKEV